MSYAFLCDGCNSFYAYEPDLKIEANGTFAHLDHPEMDYEKMDLCKKCTDDFLDWLKDHRQRSEGDAR